MTIKLYPEITQGSDEWMALRCGMLTASEMKLIITPTLKAVSNDKERAHLFELLAQRITGYVEPRYIGDDMLRGMNDEMEARALYNKAYAPVTEVGFVTNDKWGFTIGYSPDGLVGKDGQIECKSRNQRLQVATLIRGEIDPDYVIQVQTGLMVTEREWCDLVSYCGGLHMVTVRVFNDEVVQKAIAEVATEFEQRIQEKRVMFDAIIAANAGRLIPTERKIEQEMI